MAKGKVCERKSTTYSPPRKLNSMCSQRCKELENAASGTRHISGIKFACFCYFYTDQIHIILLIYEN